MNTLRTLCVIAAFAIAACDSSTAPEPEPTFPNVEGTWDYVAPVTEIQGARWTGRLSLYHSGGPTIDGHYEIRVATPTYLSDWISGPITDATITPQGQVHFRFGAWFRHDGHVQGGAMTGVWLLSGDEENWSGTFTASRQF
jgi:hypothetical protein